MSFDATRAAWAARRAGGLDGGPRLLVALAMAEMTYKPTGELQAGTRALATLCGVSQPTVTATLRALQSAGVIERTERGLGSRASRWRWKLQPPPALAPPGDNDDQRAATKAAATNDESANGNQRAATKAVARSHESNYQDQVYTRVPEHLREATAAEAVPERVAALRDALKGPRGGRRLPSSHFGDAAPPCDPADGWQP